MHGKKQCIKKATNINVQTDSAVSFKHDYHQEKKGVER